MTPHGLGRVLVLVTGRSGRLLVLYFLILLLGHVGLNGHLKKNIHIILKNSYSFIMFTFAVPQGGAPISTSSSSCS